MTGIGDILGPVGDFASGLMNIGSGQVAQGRNIDWQRELATNAVQFKMQDMERAGLNPILMMSKGGMGGPASPSGSAPGQFGNMPPLGASIANTAKAFQDISESETRIDKMRIEFHNIMADTEKKLSERNLNTQMVNESLQKISESAQRILEMKKSIQKMGSEITKNRAIEDNIRKDIELIDVELNRLSTILEMGKHPKDRKKKGSVLSALAYFFWKLKGGASANFNWSP